MRLAIFLLFILTACSTIPSPQQRVEKSIALAHQHGWNYEIITVSNHRLAIFAPNKVYQTTELAVYIEGDGFAWATRRQPSSDPTPIDPIALKLALNHPEDNAVYLARLCQYTGAETPDCGQRLWTEDRFSEDVILTMNLAVSMIKEKYQAKNITLIGYSGGGAVAALIAARRVDIKKLITIASPLDTVTWTKSKRLSPLTNSLNPADYWFKLLQTPQIHFVGSHDRIVDSSVTRAYTNRFPLESKPEIRVVPDFNHSCCWEDRFHRILNDELTELKSLQ